jgi:hypothetical protein
MGMRRRARRAAYEWPLVNVLHPVHGAFQFSIHGIRSPDGCVTLLAFHGTLNDDRTKVVKSVFASARRLRGQAVRLHEDDISEDLVSFVAERAHARPNVGVMILPGSKWGIGAAAAQNECYERQRLCAADRPSARGACRLG